MHTLIFHFSFKIEIGHTITQINLFNNILNFNLYLKIFKLYNVMIKISMLKIQI